MSDARTKPLRNHLPIQCHTQELRLYIACYRDSTENGYCWSIATAGNYWFIFLLPYSKPIHIWDNFTSNFCANESTHSCIFAFIENGISLRHHIQTYYNFVLIGFEEMFLKIVNKNNHTHMCSTHQIFISLPSFWTYFQWFNTEDEQHSLRQSSYFY